VQVCENHQIIGAQKTEDIPGGTGKRSGTV
jgi:hypothetical protein